MRTTLDVLHNEAGLVDKYIGTAYETVACVAAHLPEIKQLSFYMEDLLALANKMNELKGITDSLDGLQSLNQAEIALLREKLINITAL